MGPRSTPRKLSNATTYTLMKRLGLLVAGLLFMGLSTRAQFTYTFSAVASTYTQVSASGSDLNSIEANDVHSSTVSLGFDFGYNGLQVSQIKVNSNGWISMDTGDGPSSSEG